MSHINLTEGFYLLQTHFEIKRPYIHFITKALPLNSQACDLDLRSHLLRMFPVSLPWGRGELSWDLGQASWREATAGAQGPTHGA